METRKDLRAAIIMSICLLVFLYGFMKPAFAAPGITNIQTLTPTGLTFGEPVKYGFNEDTGHIVSGDFNKDGKIDLAVVMRNEDTSGNVTVLVGKGDGSFIKDGVLKFDYQPSLLAAADINGDGKLDFAAIEAGLWFDDRLVVFLNNGDSSYSKNYVIELESPGAMVGGDFTGDGKDDLIKTQAPFVSQYVHQDYIIVFPGNYYGTLNKEIKTEVVRNPEGVITGDFNRDGKLDAAVIHGEDHNLEGSTSNPLNPTGEVNIGRQYPAQISILTGKGDGTFTTGTAAVFPEGSKPTNIARGDFNNDEKTDLVVVDDGLNLYYVFLGKGDGLFQMLPVVDGGLLSPVNGDDSSDLISADFNGDGKTDLLRGNYYAKEIVIFLGDGQGKFDSGTAYKVETGPGSVCSADFDGDGKDDFAVTLGDSKNISIFLSGASSQKPIDSDLTGSITLTLGKTSMIVGGVNRDIDPGRSTAPVVVNGRTLIPIRAVVEAMGGNIGWNGKERKITVDLNGNNMELWIGNKTARVNGVNKVADIPPQEVNGRTMLPLRFVTENLGCNVNWDGATQTITINYTSSTTTPTQPVTPVPSPSTPPTPPSETPVEGGHTPTLTTWAGTWQTTVGLMTLTQESYDVEGSCTTSQGVEGTVAGDASGSNLKGYWYLGADEAEYDVIMSADGKTFKGQYRLYGYDTWYTLTGTRQ